MGLHTGPPPHPQWREIAVVEKGTVSLLQTLCVVPCFLNGVKMVSCFKTCSFSKTIQEGRRKMISIDRPLGCVCASV